MLNHTEDEAEPVPAAQARIKTEELARAVAAIEARRQRDAQALVGTLVIGEAVEELSLDMTPEEILAEVKAQQEEQREQEEQKEASGLYLHEYGNASNTPSWRMPAWLLAGSVVSVLTIIIWWGTANQTQPISSTVYPPPVVTQNYPNVNPPFVPGQTPPTFYRTPPGHMITRIPDGVSFGCAPYTLERVLNGEKLADIQVYDGEEAFLYGRRHFADGLPLVSPMTIYYRARGWTLIKHKGRVYVRGWAYLPILAPTSIRVFNTPDAPEIRDKASEITLPTQGVHYEGMYARAFLDPPKGMASGSGPYPASPSDQLEIRATDVHLDSHAYENW